MAGATVTMSTQSQQNPLSANTTGSDSSSFQMPNRFSQSTTSMPQTDSTRPGTPHATSSQTFHRSYQFRPRFPPNKGQDDVSGGLLYDGKRMRKAIHRKTVDYNPSVLNYIQNRVWQRDRRDQHQIQPDSLYAVDLVPPQALLEHPMNCVTTRFVRTSTNKYRCPIFCVTWTPEGRRLVTGASSGEFTLWNGLTFNFETILQAHETAVRAMRWSHADAWMVTADHAGYIKYWQSNMNNVKMYQGHKEPIRGISFCPSDTKFASCSDDGTVRIWDFMRCQEERILRGHGADVRCVDWHPQKALIASGSKDNQQPVKLWDPKTGNSLATLHAHKHTVMDLKWHANGNWMLTASRDHLLKLFDVRNLKEELQTFKGHKREATAIGWHPIHEGLFVSGSADGALMFWMVGCDHEVGGMEEAHEGMVWSVSWHPLGHILASGSNDHATKFWTRNRPGDEMRDKYNLNTLPLGMMEQELLEYNQESTVPNLPGIGLEQGLPDNLQIKDEQRKDDELPTIPGLDWEEDAALLKTEEKASLKKVPYARPVPRVFEQAWTGEIDVDQLKKEQQQQQQLQQQKPQFIPTQPTLLLAQQVLGAAIAGTLRQQLAASEAGRMILPGGPLMLGPGGPHMIIAPGQPVMGSRPGQMMLFPSGPGAARPLGPSLPALLQQQNNPNPLSQQQGVLLGLNAGAKNINNQVNAGGPQNGTVGALQQGGPPVQAGLIQNQPSGVHGNAIKNQTPAIQANLIQNQPAGVQGGAIQNQPAGVQGGAIQNQPPAIQTSLIQNQPSGVQGGVIQNQTGLIQKQPGGIQNQPTAVQAGGIQIQPQNVNTNQGQLRPQGPVPGQIRPMGPQNQIRPQRLMGDPQGQTKPAGILGASPNLQSKGQQPANTRQPGPGSLFQGPGGPQVQFNSGQQHQGITGPQDLDRDERFSGQNQNQTRGPPNVDMDQDYRPRVYNGPAGPATLEDQDFRQKGPMTGPNLGNRRGNMGDVRNRGGHDFHGGENRGHGDDFQGGHMGKRGYMEAESYDEYGDVDERVMDSGDIDHRATGSRGRGGRGRGGGYNARGETGGWDNYGRRQEYEEDGWNGGGGYEEGYGDDYEGEYEEPEDRRGSNRGRKRVWEEGPGGPRGRGAWAQGEGRGHSRPYRGPRGRGGGFRGGGWGRGSSGERGSWSRGGHRGGY